MKNESPSFQVSPVWFGVGKSAALIHAGNSTGRMPIGQCRSLRVGDELESLNSMFQRRVAVCVDRTDAHMHHKFAVFDGQRLLNGSYNWTRSAASVNEENIVLSTEPVLVRRFLDEFDTLWQQLQDPR